MYSGVSAVATGRKCRGHCTLSGYSGQRRTGREVSAVSPVKAQGEREESPC